MSNYKIYDHGIGGNGYKYDYITSHIALETRTLCGKFFVRIFINTEILLHNWKESSISVKNFTEQTSPDRYYCRKCAKIYEKKKEK